MIGLMKTQGTEGDFCPLFSSVKSKDLQCKEDFGKTKQDKPWGARLRGCSCFEQEVGPDEIQRSPPDSVVL